MTSRGGGRRWLWALLVIAVVAAGASLWMWRWYQRNGVSDSNLVIRRWLTDPSSHAELITPGYVACPDAPFILPSEGLVGLLYRDPAGPYDVLRPHTGVDIFGAGPSGTVPIVAAYEGWLTRLDNWRSTVIIRHEDPLQEGRTIWTYYTHMANRDGTQSYIVEDFPPGTREVYVEQGRLLGYQGEYNGDAFRVAMHLHFSITTSDADGGFRNEAVLGNTLDPSHYLGLNVDFSTRPTFPIRCAT